MKWISGPKNPIYKKTYKDKKQLGDFKLTRLRIAISKHKKKSTINRKKLSPSYYLSQNIDQFRQL
ncbi:unnamed protein product [Cunninghamella echinulata]